LANDLVENVCMHLWLEDLACSHGPSQGNPISNTTTPAIHG
jgi:hypothetical protein